MKSRFGVTSSKDERAVRIKWRTKAPKNKAPSVAPTEAREEDEIQDSADIAHTVISRSFRYHVQGENIYFPCQ